MLEAAKDMYALESGLSNRASITWDNIGMTIPPIGNLSLKQWPICPDYTDGVSQNMTTAERRAITKQCHQLNPAGSNAAGKINPAHALR